MEINSKFDIENVVFNMLKTYLTSNSKFSPHVFNKAPKQLTENLFPTVVFKESSNTDIIGHRTLDRTQFANQITDTIEIYTKDMTVNGVLYASKVVMSELKYLVFDFFEQLGALRISCTPAEYNDYQVDRLVIIEQYAQNSWNKKIG